MWDNDLQRAKDAIQRGDYENARIILEMMPDNYIARDWLAKLNRKNLKFRHENNNTVIVQNIISKDSSHKLPAVPVTIVIVNMLFWVFLILGTVATNPLDAQVQANIVLALCIGFPLLFGLYYLFWRFFWWALALSWLLASCGVILALAAGAQLLIPAS